MPQVRENRALLPLSAAEGRFFCRKQVSLAGLLALPFSVGLDVRPGECRHTREDIGDLNQWFDFRLRRHNLNHPEVFLEANSEGQTVSVSLKAAFRRRAI